MTPEYVVVLTTLPADADAPGFARQLVDERLAACVNLLPVMESIYRWDGRVEQDTERQLVLKTSRDRVPALWERVRELHPYEIAGVRRAAGDRRERRLPALGGESTAARVEAALSQAPARELRLLEPPCSACSRSAMRSSASSMPGRDADHAVGQPDGGPPLGRHGRVRHRRRMRDERLDAAEALGQRHQPDAVADPARPLERARIERHHPAEAAHLPLRQLVLRMIRQPGIDDPLDPG